MTEPIVFNFTEATIPLPDRTLSRKQGGCLVFIAAMQIMHAEQHCQKSPDGFYWFGSRDPHQPDIPMDRQEWRDEGIGTPQCPQAMSLGAWGLLEGRSVERFLQEL